MGRHFAHPGTIFSGAMAAVLLACTPAQSAPAKTAAPKAPTSTPEKMRPSEDLVVTGLPAVAERSLKLWAPDSTCVDFEVYDTDGKADPAVLAATGFPGARLFPITDSSQRCGEEPSQASAVLRLTLGQQPTRLRLAVPSRAVATGDTGSPGQLLIVRDGRTTVKTELTIRAPAETPFAKAVLWFLGIALPAALTGLIGLYFFRWQKQVEADNKRLSDFETFRRDKLNELRQFFGGLYPVILRLADDDPEFPTRMSEELGQTAILQHLPRPAFNRINTALAAGDRADLASALAENFPEHSGLILQSPNSQDR